MNANPKLDAPKRATFPAPAYGTWHRLVESELKDAPFDQRMFTATREGITLRPIYRREDIEHLPHLNSWPGFAPFVRGVKAGGSAPSWLVSQEINFSSPAEFNLAARNSIDRGLTALNMVLDQATRNGHDPDWAQPEEVGAGGLSIACLADLDRALEGIDLEKTALFVRSGASALPFAALLAALARQRKKPETALQGCIEMDPLGVLSHEGSIPQSLGGAYREMAALLAWSSRHAPRLQTICVHSRAWHEAGGHAAQELAFTLATAVEYLRQMHKRGLDANAAAPRLRFAMTVGENFFMEIAKLRALRTLWARVVAVAGGNAAAQKISLHARTSHWNKTVNDPHNNIVRCTVEALAAAVGGCDSLQVGAFDEIIRPADDFSRRIARNIQLILQRECHLGRVIDPAGGSWHVEVLTAELAARAWALFQEVEKHGGMEAALREGFPQNAVETTAASRIKAAAEGHESIIGVNRYVNSRETPLPVETLNLDGFRKRRAFEIATHRTSMDDTVNALVLQKLSQQINASGPQLVKTCVEAATAGATLGEIARAVRIHDTPSERVTPVKITRAAAALERARKEGQP